MYIRNLRRLVLQRSKQTKGYLMNIAYVRVSAADQNEDRQRCSLEPYHIERWYIEKASGKDTNRPRLKEMLDFVREGDTIYISEFSRLGRSTRDLLDIIDFLQAKKVNLVSQKENLDCNSPSGRLQLTMLAAISEFEREMILERQREGIKIAREKGKYVWNSYYLSGQTVNPVACD